MLRSFTQMLKCLAGWVIFVHMLLGQWTRQGYSVAINIVPVVWWVDLIVWIDVNVCSYTLAALPSAKEPPVSNEFEDGWSPQPVRTFWRIIIFVFPVGGRTLDHPAHKGGGQGVARKQMPLKCFSRPRIVFFGYWFEGGGQVTKIEIFWKRLFGWRKDRKRTKPCVLRNAE